MTNIINPMQGTLTSQFYNHCMAVNYGTTNSKFIKTLKSARGNALEYYLPRRTHNNLIPELMNIFPLNVIT